MVVSIRVWLGSAEVENYKELLVDRLVVSNVRVCLFVLFV
jgi:hypothetical protein